MKVIEIKHRYSREVLFSYECEGNTIKITLLKAVSENANLSDADLRNANLWDADLRNADLSDADLWDADLRNADLRDADLRNANLSDANLRNANLRNANLSDANLWNANLSDANLSDANLSDANLWNANLWDADQAIKIPIHCKWSHGVTKGNLIHIGCKKRTIKEWDCFFSSKEELTTKRDSQEFKKIQAVYEAYRAYLTFLEND